MRRGIRQWGGVAALATAVLVLAACDNDEQSVLDPVSHPARDVASLWWWMLVAAGVVFLGAVAMLLIGWIRRREPGLPFLGGGERTETRLVVLFGMVIPVVVLVALFFFSNVYVIGKTEPPSPGSTSLSVEVTGHQWWWEVHYPGTTAATANVIHIPARTRVNVIGNTPDVHEFGTEAAADCR